MPVVLRDGKKTWKPTPRPKMLRGLALNPNAASEARYYQALSRLIFRMTRDVHATLERFYETPHAQAYFAEDATTSAQAKILMNALRDKFEQIFNLASKPLADTVANEASKSSASALHASLKKLSGGITLKTDSLTGELKDVFTSAIAENVSLIKSIPSQYLTQVEGAVYRSITTGRGLADLVPYLHEQQGVTLRRARLIASDQNRKIFNSLNRARLQKIGIKEFEWLHSQAGQKPRKLHITPFTSGGLNHGIFRIDQPPIIDLKTGERGLPGTLINCFCRLIPVIKFEQEEEES